MLARAAGSQGRAGLPHLRAPDASRRGLGMSLRGAAAVAALTALAPFLVACGGGGSNNAAESLPTTAPTLTVPGSSKTPTVSSRSDTTTTDTTTSTTTTATTPQTTTTTTNPSTPQGGAAAPQTGGATPDSPQNDQAPVAGTPASKFEQFCKDNPGAC